jgi:hypothetical protein
MRNILNGKWIYFSAALVLCSGASADPDRHDHYRDHYRFHRHGDIHRFYAHDYARWRGGHWYHGNHGGRLGWWWTVDGFWYSYARPIYPYTDPYMPPAIVYRQGAMEQSDEPAYESTPPPAQNWYYCNSSKNYYPYVSACPEGWQTVPATPPDAEDR